MSEANEALAQAHRHALQGDFVSAYRIYETLIPSGGAAAYMEFGKAKFLEHSGESLEAAAALFLRACELDESATDARLWLADLCSIGYGEGYSTAADLYREVTRMDATISDAYIGLGLLRGAPGDPVSHDEAIAAFQRAAEVAPERLDARIDLANALIRSGRVSEAQEALEEAERLAERAGEVGRLSALRVADERLAHGQAVDSFVFFNDSPRYAWLVPGE